MAHRENSGYRRKAVSWSDRIVDWAKRSSFLRLLVVITLTAELLTAAVNLVNIYVWWGDHPEKLFIVGIVDALFVSITALPVIIFIIMRLKQAERDSAEMSSYLDNILRTSTDMAIAATDTGFRVTLFNPAAEEMFGYDSKEIIGKDVRRMQGGDIIDPEKFAAALETLRREGELSFSFAQQKTGGVGTRFLDVRISAITDRYGALDGYVLMARDVTERRIALGALKESEEKFRTLVEKALVGVYIVQDERFVYVNPRFAEIVGYDRDEITGGMKLEDLVTPESMGLARQNIGRRLAGEVESARYRLRGVRKDGALIDVEVLGSATGYNGKPAIIGTLVDITESKKTEDALRESEAKFRTLVEHSLIGVAIIQDGKYVYVNPRHAQMLGYTQDEMTSLGSVLEIVHPDDRETVAENVRKRTSGEVRDIRYNFRFLSRKGETVHVEVHGSTSEYHGRSAVIGSVLDITERVKAEAEILKLNEGLERMVGERTAELVEREHSYRTLAENLPGIVYRVFIREGNRMQFFNQMHEPLTGYTLEELRPGQCCPIDPLMHPEDRGRVVDELKRAVKEDRPFLVEYRLVRKDGGIRHMQERGRPVRGPDGRPLYIDGVILDITELKRAQEDREAMQARLSESQKMEAVGNLAGGIAHDFSSLLTVIQGDCELLSDTVGEGKPGGEYLAQIKRAAESAAELTRKLLIFSRRKKLEKSVIDVNETVGEMAGMLGRLIGKGITVETELDEGVWKLLADASGVEQVVMNLALNARDAMPDGGTISISTGRLELDEEFCRLRKNARPGRYVRLSVSDTGAGMDEETRKRIFEPFFSTKPKGRGTGLGLSVVYGIVSEHGGWVDVTSSPGQGARFDVYLEAAGTAGG